MRTLVIGYGNALRGDDAVGLHVADAIHRRALPDVVVCSLHQLTPELALDLGEADLVVFVDADVHADGVTVRPLSPATTQPRTTHHLRPEALLALTVALDLPLPRAVAVGVPARDLSLSTTLSTAADIHVGEAVEQVLGLLGVVDA